MQVFKNRLNPTQARRSDASNAAEVHWTCHSRQTMLMAERTLESYVPIAAEGLPARQPANIRYPDNCAGNSPVLTVRYKLFSGSISFIN